MMTPLRVLIVDDLKDDVLLVVDQSKQGDFEVGFQLVDTKDAMKAAVVEQAGGISIDYVMPQFSGSETEVSSEGILHRIDPGSLQCPRTVPEIFDKG